MKRQDAETIVTEYLKPIFGFALKRCRSIHDAEDLSQEIVLRAFRALLQKDDIADPGKFIWTVAHNALSNYYRDSAKTAVGVSIDDVAELLADPTELPDGDDTRDAVDRLHREIAYLSKLQRQIVIAYYYENRRQADIAKMLGIPLGTVKWHLFEAKKELKRGMDTVRNSSELKFNPVRLHHIGTNGAPGTKGPNRNFFRSALSQNIAYVTRREYKSVNEIADALGVSPVYVESEAEYLEKYGFLLKRGDRYISNILISEPTAEVIRLQDKMYEGAAELIAGELFDEIMDSGILDDVNIYGGVTEQPTMTYTPHKDKNFMMWALFPYVAALSGEKQFEVEETVSFDEAATLRPDGGHNVCDAFVESADALQPKYRDSMDEFCGICWNRYADLTLWQIDTEWSTTRITEDYHYTAPRDLKLLSQLDDGTLSADEYAYLSEKGYIFVVRETYEDAIEADPGLKCPEKVNQCLFRMTAGTVVANVVISPNDGCVKTVLRCPYITNAETNRRLLAIGDRIKEKHWDELKTLRQPYIDAVLAMTPEHLRKMQMFELQYIFFSDGWFILHCLKNLVNSGKLKPPTEDQRKSLTTLIIEDK